MIPLDFLKTLARDRGVSETELEALSLAINGQSTKESASQLDISEDAVRKRLSEVYQKFKISGRGPVKLAQLQQLLVALYQEYKAHADEVLPSHLVNPKINTAETRQDWGEAPDVSVFYGRAEELEVLEQWIVKHRCRLVALLGMGGTGKTSLAVKLARTIKDEFEYVIWRSLRNAPPLLELLAEMLKALSHSQETDLPKNVDEGVSRLIAVLRDRRILLLFDDVEAILRSGDRNGRYLEGREGYGILLRELGEKLHQSCLILSSQEKPRDIKLLESPARPVRSWQLEGLKPEDARLILQEKGLTGEQQWDELVRIYGGNPLALKLIAATIQDIFNSDVEKFLKLGTIVLSSDFREILAEQFNRLSSLEEKVIQALAQANRPILFQELRETIPEIEASDLIEVLEALGGRSLIEKQPSKDTTEFFFTLQPVVRKYVTKYRSQNSLKT